MQTKIVKYVAQMLFPLVFPLSMAIYVSNDRIMFTESMNRILLEIQNHPNLTWVPEMPDKFTTFDEARVLLGAIFSSEEDKRKSLVIDHEHITMAIPQTFDSREQWKMCPSIGKIRDQSNCGSCWAFGAVEAMSDRICVKSKGKIAVELSARDLVSCCDYCGFGCFGGMLNAAWGFWVENGIVTGGSKENSTGCVPYPFSKCEHHKTGVYRPCGSGYLMTPLCLDKCQTDYNHTYNEDKFYGNHSYYVKKSVTSIQKEIMLNGPVEAAFWVYEDFFLYKSGIFQHIKGNSLGGHAIKIIGWGVENQTAYWLCANSWNEDWGEKGFFKIIRGSNHCGIESEIVAGIPVFK